MPTSWIQLINTTSRSVLSWAKGVVNLTSKDRVENVLEPSPTTSILIENILDSSLKKPRNNPEMYTYRFIASTLLFAWPLMGYAIYHTVQNDPLAHTLWYQKGVMRYFRRNYKHGEMNLLSFPPNDPNLTAVAFLMASHGLWKPAVLDVSMPYYALPFDRAMDFLGVDHLYGWFKVGESSVITAGASFTPIICDPEDDCLNVELRRGYDPQVSKTSPFFWSLKQNNQPTGKGTSRHLLQEETAEPLDILSQHVQEDKVLHQALLDAFQDLAWEKCSEDLLHSIIYRVQTQKYAYVLTQNNPDFWPHVALHLWYKKIKNKLEIEKIQAEFVKNVVFDNECHLHSNKQTAYDSHARVVIGENNEISLLINKQMIEMLQYSIKIRNSFSLLYTQTVLPSLSLTPSEPDEETRSLWVSETQTLSPSLLSSKSEVKTLSLSGKETRSLLASETQTLSPSMSIFQWGVNTSGIGNMSEYWTWKQIQANTANNGGPSARCSHAMGSIGENKLFVGFGQTACGSDNAGSRYSDTYNFDFETGNWTLIASSLSSRQSPASYSYNGSTWIYGGRLQSNTDLLQFHDKGYFSNQTNNAVYSIYQCYFNMFNLNKSFYILGGRCYSSSWYDNNRLLKLKGQTWEDIGPSPFSTIPNCATLAHSIACITGSNAVWIFNETEQWTQLTQTVQTPNAPSPRTSTTMAPDRNGFLLWGGIESSTGSILNDLYRFDIVEKKWTRLIVHNQAGSPPARIQAPLVFIKNNLWSIYGGQPNSPYITYNDLWILQQTTLSLYDVNVSPNPIFVNQPFNLSWKVNITGGATNHSAHLLFGGQNYTQIFAGLEGSMMFIANKSMGNFSIPITIFDGISAKFNTTTHISFFIS